MKKILSTFLLFCSLAIFSQTNFKKINLIPNRQAIYVGNMLNGKVLQKQELHNFTNTCISKQQLKTKTVFFEGNLPKYSLLRISISQNSKYKSLKFYALLLSKNNKIVFCKFAPKGKELKIPSHQTEYKIIIGVFDSSKNSNANFSLKTSLKSV